MNSMAAIKHIFKLTVVLILVNPVGQLFGQKDKDFERIEKKVDSILYLMTGAPNAVEVNTSESSVVIDCSVKLDSLTKIHAQELAATEANSEKYKQQIEQIQKEHSDLQKLHDKTNEDFRKQLTSILDYNILGGISIGKQAAEELLTLAQVYKTTNYKEFETYVQTFNEVIELENDFNAMQDLEKVKAKAWGLHSKTYSYAGLQKDVIQLLFKLENYCDYEQKLLDVIALSKTQSSEDNRIKQLLRREDSFNGYPALKAEIEKVKANQNYTVIPKCIK